jgi:hypothetical protein
MDEMSASILKYAPREHEQTVLSILAQLAIAHAQFETIHPYHDGNGRTGRLLMPLMLAAEGYPPLYLSGALLRAKSEYYAALASVQLQGEWGPWLELLGHAVVECCDESISIAEDLLALAESWERELRRYRAHSATRRLPRFLVNERQWAVCSRPPRFCSVSINSPGKRPERTRRSSQPNDLTEVSRVQGFVIRTENCYYCGSHYRIHHGR